MLFLDLAWRNILRNPRRTALTLLAIALGVGALVFAWALFDGGNDQSINAMTGTFTGHVQVHRRGYTDDPSLDRVFHGGELDRAKLAATPGVLAVAERLQAPVLVSSQDNSRGVLLVGVDPQAEPRVTGLQNKIREGSYLRDGEVGQLLLGRSLAKALKVAVGDEVAVLTQGLYGAIGASRYTVTGLYDTGNEMVDSMQAFVTLDDARALLSAGDELTTLALRLGNYGQSDAAVAALQAALPATFEVEGWQRLLPDVAQKVSFHEWVATVIMVVLFAIVMVGVTNTIMMSVLERMREFGVMMALGTRPRHIFTTILFEGLLLGLLGFAAGLAVGYALVAHFGAVGIDFSDQADALQQMQGVGTRLYPHLSLARMLFIGAAVMCVALGASLYPAFKTALLAPLAALRGLAGLQSGVIGGARSVSRYLLAALALRNLARHPLRTILTGFGVTLAMAAFVFLGCFVVGYYDQIVENSTGFITGDAQIQHREFKTELKPQYMLADGPAVLAAVSGDPRVRVASPRVQSPAMLSSPAGAEPLQVIGVDPARETQVTFLYKSVREGSYLRADRDHEIVIGRKLAERLKLRVGDKTVLMAQDVAGNLVSESFVVAGLFNTGSHGFDETMGHVSLPALQRMLGMGQGLSSVAFRLRDPATATADLAALASALPDPAARVYSWQELLPEVVQMNTMFKGSLALVMLVVFLTIALVIMNTVLMSVMERTREFGTMLALGSQPRFIVRLVLLESAVVGVAGAVAGLVLGGGAAWAHSITGMSMKAHGMTSIPGTTDVVFPKLTWATTVEPTLVMPLLLLLAALYPALKAASLEPVKALRHV